MCPSVLSALSPGSGWGSACLPTLPQSPCKPPEVAVDPAQVLSLCSSPDSPVSSTLPLGHWQCLKLMLSIFVRSNSCSTVPGLLSGGTPTLCVTALLDVALRYVDAAWGSVSPCSVTVMIRTTTMIRKLNLTVHYVPEAALIIWISVHNPCLMREVLFLFNFTDDETEQRKI